MGSLKDYGEARPNLAIESGKENSSRLPSQDKTDALESHSKLPNNSITFSLSFCILIIVDSRFI